MRVHVVFIGLGLIFLVVGMAFGMWMGINQDFQYAAAHAHWNLVGFVTSAIYGLTHRAYPKLAESRLTWIQCVLHVIGVLIFAPGIVIAVAMDNPVAAIVGGNVLILAALMFMFIYFTHDHRTSPD
jgi:peptidoglycan/LPS O-acetylase OafA/YrhL